MRQRLIAFAVFTAFAAPAFADDSVTLYGILDAAVVNVQHSLNFDPFLSQTTVPTPTKSGNNAATGVVSGGISASRWGLRGQEDLPGGWAAIFDLESAININSGNISNGAETLANQKATGPNVSNDSSLSGQLFGRAAYLGLSSPTYGTFTLGRNPNIGLDLIPIYDPLRGSPQMFSPIGFSSSYAGGGYTDDARVDGSVKYGLRIGNVKIGALYKFGGIAGAAEANSGGEFNIGYEAGPFGIQGLYESFKDATSLSNANGTTIPLGSLGVTFANTQAWILLSRYNFDKLTVKAGFEREGFQNPSNPLVDLQTTSLYGYSVITNPTNVAPAKATSVTTFSTGKKVQNAYWLGGDYNVTAALNASLAAYQLRQNDYSGDPAGVNSCSANPLANSKCSGKTRYYSALLDYNLSKRVDIYSGVMFSKADGGPATGFTSASNRSLGAGLRIVF